LAVTGHLSIAYQGQKFGVKVHRGATRGADRTAFNVVRVRVKPGREQRFVDAHRKVERGFKGFIRGNLIKTGEQTFCIIGEWRNFQSIVGARPQMIAILDATRDMLEDLGGGLGVTDPVSGQTVVTLMPGKVTKKRKTTTRKTTKRPRARRSRAKRKR